MLRKMGHRRSTSVSQARHELFESDDKANDAFAAAIREEAEREARTGVEPDLSTNAVLRARCLLSEMKRLFEYLGWKTLPRTERGRRILRLGADLSWVAGPLDPKRSVWRWCRRYGQSFSRNELETIIAATESSNKRWTADQIATVLGVTASDREAMGFRQIGACDDPNYEKRSKIRREKNAASQRRHRAATSTGRKPGRPALNLSPEERQRRKKAQDANRARKYRASRKTPSTIFYISKNVDAIRRDAVEWRHHGAFTGRARKRPALHVVADTRHKGVFSARIKGAVAAAALHHREMRSDPWLHRPRLSANTIVTIKLKEGKQ